MKRTLPPEAEIPAFPLSQLSNPELAVFRQDLEHHWSHLAREMPEFVAALRDCAEREFERRRTNGQEQVLLQLPVEFVRGSPLRRAMVLALEHRDLNAQVKYQLARMYALILAALDNRKRLLGKNWDSDSVDDADPVH